VIKSRKLHKIIGLTLVLPMLGWTLTGFVFFIKPGYQEAYQQLTVKNYPLSQTVLVKPKENWQEVKLVRSILGDHLLVTSDNKTWHLIPESLKVKAQPSEPEFKSLLRDAFRQHSERYGEIVSVNGLSAKTSTGVEVTLDWNNLSLSQTGQDTHLINLLYKIHYLQWTGHKVLDQVLGVLGLILLISLTILGVRLYVKQRI
jgi:uncharacterized iron-regulated membrane protein